MPLVLAPGPFAVVRRLLGLEVRDEPFRLVARLLEVRDEPLLLVDLLDLERPRPARLLEDRVVCAIAIAFLGFLPAAPFAAAVLVALPAELGI